MNEIDNSTLLHKELDLIQSCISRMAQNSFTIKGWYFALIIVISAWKFDKVWFYSCTLIATAIIFYVLNLQFYIYEHQFRDLYKKRIKLRCEDKNYDDDLYSLEVKGKNITINLLLCKYIWGNKMLLFMYFGICLLLVLSNMFLKKS